MITRTQSFETYHSEVLPSVCTEYCALAEVIAWADANPVVWRIVTGHRSKAFGRGSSVYLGCAQQGMDSGSILERARHFRRELDRTDDSIFTWRARFTFERYKDKGFTGGFFQQHDPKHPRSCLYLDYTAQTLEEVLDRFAAWMDPYYDTRYITLNGRTVRVVMEN